MWNTIASSKITRQSELKKNYQIHKQKLMSIRPTFHLQQPYQPTFIFSKPKLEMARRDRLIEIDRHNALLLRKMDKIYDGKSSHPQSQSHRTLSQHVTTEVNDKIEVQNKRMCVKLMRASSHYPTNRIITETSRLGRISLNISENARRAKSVSRLSLTRPDSARLSTSSKFIRSGAQKENKQQQILDDQKFKKGWCRPGSAPSVRVRKDSNDHRIALQDVNGINEGEEEQIMI